MKATENGEAHSQTCATSRNSLQRDRSETEEIAGECGINRITENNITNESTYRLRELILDRCNMNKAYKKVKSNKGSHGIDGMGVYELGAYLHLHGDEIRQSILKGKYKPNPVRRVEIPKEDGKKRPLGIPTAVDRVIQQAIAQGTVK